MTRRGNASILIVTLVRNGIDIMKNTIIGIDVGGSTTKIVGFKQDGDERELITPLFVKAGDPITSLYGAFGRFLNDNSLSLEDIECVKVTGVGSSYLSKPIYNLRCDNVSEFESIGRGKSRVGNEAVRRRHDAPRASFSALRYAH